MTNREILRLKYGNILYHVESVLNSVGQSVMMQGSLIPWFS